MVDSRISLRRGGSGGRYNSERNNNRGGEEPRFQRRSRGPNDRDDEQPSEEVHLGVTALNDRYEQVKK